MPSNCADSRGTFDSLTGALWRVGTEIGLRFGMRWCEKGGSETSRMRASYLALTLVLAVAVAGWARDRSEPGW